MSLHVLRGGLAVRVRPLVPGDEPLLREAFEALSPQSRYQRFFRHVNELSDELWRYLCNVDGRDHVAFVAVALTGRWRNRVVGVARFVRAAVDPTSAEVAITIADGCQRRGLGTLLFDQLKDAAPSRGVSHFVAYALPTNVGIRRLIARHGDFEKRRIGDDEVLWLELAASATAGPALRYLFPCIPFLAVHREERVRSR